MSHITKHQKSIDYTREGIVVNHIADHKVITEKESKQFKTSTCFKIKHVGCSGLVKEFLN